MPIVKTAPQAELGGGMALLRGSPVAPDRLNVLLLLIVEVAIVEQLRRGGLLPQVDGFAHRGLHIQ